MAKTVLSNEFVAQLSASYTRALRQIDSLVAQNRRLEKNNTMLAKALSKQGNDAQEGRFVDGSMGM